PLSKVVCYKCGEKEHIRRYYRNPKKKNQISNKKDESVNAVEQVDTTEITAMWYDSGKTTHVCSNRDLFKTYKETEDGHKFMMGDNHTSKVIGSGNVEIQFTSEKKLILMNVLHVPNIRKNLVSGFKLCKSGVKVVIESDKVICPKPISSLGNSGGILCVWEPTLFVKDNVAPLDNFLAAMGTKQSKYEGRWAKRNEQNRILRTHE
nr:zinc finger, CCHC-type [Tanacetum cinerariifolium]